MKNRPPKGGKCHHGSTLLRNFPAGPLFPTRRPETESLTSLKTVQEFLRQAHVTTTLQLYAQSDMESKRDAQGRYLEQMLGDRVHLLTERI
jgi:hypothetical protein